MIKHKTGYGLRIEEVEIVRETAASVFYSWHDWNGKVAERKAAKRSDYACYHDSWSGAHSYLLAKAEAKVAAARRALESANGELGNIKGMKPAPAEKESA